MASLKPSINVDDRARGCMIGLLVGDALGAPVEGFPPQEISAIASEHCGNECKQGEWAIAAVQNMPTRTDSCIN